MSGDNSLIKILLIIDESIIRMFLPSLNYILDIFYE